MSDSVTPEKIDTTGLDASELLALLRDIQEPVAPEGTSLWLITLTVMLTVSLIALVWFQRQRKRYAFRTEALKRIDSITNQIEDNDSSSLFDLASLLRQLMRYRRGDMINSLDGHRWLNALDDEFTSDWFSEGRGQIFGMNVYQRQTMTKSDISSLCSDLKAQIRRLEPHKPGS